ncbi:MAG: metallophosphoesterase family protein [Ignavibacteriae bacterium]|nr:metallophosphoesterase family protein [Ignavibacteriota bacterium]
MKKLNTILLLFTLLFTLPVLGNELIHGPYLQNAQPNEITVLWETKSATIGKVLFGLNKAKLTNSSVVDEMGTLHKVKLKNLIPHQSYYYKCIWENGETDIGNFRTAPDNDQTSMRFAIVGDSRSDLKMCMKISDLIIDKDPDIVLHSGDIVASGKNLHEWKTFLFEPMEKLLRNIPFYPVLGNHEQESSHYYNFFPLHNKKPWWSVDYGSVHIIGLDTSVPTDPESEQYQFLLADLKKNKKEWTIVMFHYPLFHSHPNRPVYEFRYDWQPLFMKYGVDLALTGHDHYYHRSFPIGRMSENQKGVVHITSAGGGASLYPTVPQTYSAFDRSLYHFLVIDVTENELEVRAIDDNNNVFDAIIINKNQDNSATNFVEYEMFELERNLKNKLGSLSPNENNDGLVYFDTTFTIETNFYMSVTGNYTWQATDAWEIEQSNNKFIINPGGKLQIEFSGHVNKKDFMPTPELKLHIEADNSTRNITGHRPYQNYLGFRNQDLQFSIEEAAYKNAVLTSVDDLSPIFFFLDYYAESKHAYDVIVALGAKILRTQDKRIISNLEKLLKNHPSDLNKFRIYPFYFLFNDFSNLDEWIAVMGRLPSEQLSFAPKLICQLTELDNFNSRNIKDWNLIGPFPASEGKGLSTIYPPEVEFDFTKKYKTESDENIEWKEYHSNSKSIDLIKVLSANEYAFKEGVAYAHTSVVAKEEGEIILLLGSNDDPAVWVNNKEVHRKIVARGVQSCDDIIVVPVKKGNNNILIKVVQRGGAWGLNLRISDWMRVLE